MQKLSNSTRRLVVSEARNVLEEAARAVEKCVNVPDGPRVFAGLARSFKPITDEEVAELKMFHNPHPELGGFYAGTSLDDAQDYCLEFWADPRKARGSLTEEEREVVGAMVEVADHRGITVTSNGVRTTKTAREWLEEYRRGGGYFGVSDDACLDAGDTWCVGEVLINGPDGGFRWPALAREGGVCVTPGVDEGFTITHVSTGFAIFKHIKSYRLAELAMYLVAGVTDWQKIASVEAWEKLPHVERRRISSVVMEYAMELHIRRKA